MRGAVSKVTIGLVAAVLALTVLAAPSQAEPPARASSAGQERAGLLPGLLLPGVMPAAEPPVPASFGRVTAPNQRLKRGCADYRFNYRINVPVEQWDAVVLLRDSAGRGMGQTFLLHRVDERQGRKFFRMCQAAIRPGVHRLRMTVRYFFGNTIREQTVPIETFRITRRR